MTFGMMMPRQMNHLELFEDDPVPQLSPIIDFRPVFDLFLGTQSMLSRTIALCSPKKIGAWVRPAIRDRAIQCAPKIPINHATSDGEILFVNARLVLNPETINILSTIKKNEWLTTNGHIAAARLDGNIRDQFHAILETGSGVSPWEDSNRHNFTVRTAPNLNWIDHPWDLISLNPSLLHQDARQYPMGTIQGSCGPFVSLKGGHQIYIGTQSIIEDFTLLDASIGPIIISNNVKIESGSRIIGPTYIGDRTIIKSAQITACSIGPDCRIGGELTDSIIHGRSNKGHSGFLGHSIVGEWVNLGAGTTTSNLKNTYGHIRIENGNGPIDTGLSFCGSIIGDHVKTGIGSMLTTGSIIGFGAMLMGTTVHEKWIPPFTFGSAGSGTHVRFPEFLATATRMMARRSISVDASYRESLSRIYESNLKGDPE